MRRSDLELRLSGSAYQQGISVDCVVLGFHEGRLKVLLNKFRCTDKWMLPGGFVYKDEDIDDAAYRHLRNRTGLKEIYLKQFYTFGNHDRLNLEENKKILDGKGIRYEEASWYLDRFVTVAYYALVRYSDVHIYSDPEDEEVKWCEMDAIPALYADHNEIIHKAMETIRVQIGYIPIGYELLPDKFTMPELRNIYEAVIGKPLDRRNFQRKMLSIGLFEKLNESRKNGAHKSPHLYKFKTDKYESAIKYGLQLMEWKVFKGN